MATGLYVKLDASYHLDDKVADLSPEAELMWVRVLCHCKRLGNDGFVHERVLNGIAPAFEPRSKRAASATSPRALMHELVTVGLMNECDKGWIVAAWLRHNPSPEDIDNTREQARLRKQRQRDRQRAERAQRDVSRNGHSVTGHASRDQPEPEPEPEPEKNYLVARTAEVTLVADEVIPAQSAGKPSSRRTRIAPDMPLTDAMRSYALEHGCHDPQATFAAWHDWHTAKGDTAADWQASWRTWCRNEVRFAGKRNGLAVVNGGQPIVSKSMQALLNHAQRKAGGAS